MDVSQEWFAVRTLSCREKQVSRHFGHQTIEHFLPVTRNRRRWKNGCTVVVERPLFPGYLFVHIPRAERVRVLGVPGVHSIVGTGKSPIALPNCEIEALRRGADLLNLEPCPYLNVGERATVLRGPLEGMSGIVVRKKNGLRFVLSLDLIRKSVAVELEAADLMPDNNVWSSIDSSTGFSASASVPEGVC
jgi:transcription antitermination factor NusG